MYAITRNRYGGPEVLVRSSQPFVKQSQHG